MDRKLLKERPDLHWRMESRASIRVVEAGRAQINEMLYLFGGYEELGKFFNSCYGFDLNAGVSG